MGFKPHTRRNYAHKHLDGIRSLDGVASADIEYHDEEWLVATFSFQTTATRDPEDVHADIVDWFTSEAPRVSFTGLDGSSVAEFEDDSGEFAVHYPRN